MANNPSAYRTGRLYNLLMYLSLFLVVFSGFGQMPIFKRYYLSDLPGMGWTADFYVTLVIHYLAGAVLLGLIVYWLMGRLLVKGHAPLQGTWPWIRGSLLLILIATGLLLAARNIKGVYLPSGFDVIVPITHAAATMLFLLGAAAVSIWRLAKPGL